MAPDDRHTDDDATEAQLSALETAVPGFNRYDIISCVREAFTATEAATSLASPEICRPFVTDVVYSAVCAKVEELRSRGHRRVHGKFDIAKTTILDMPTAVRVSVRLGVASSIFELDEHGLTVAGSDEQLHWTEEIVAVRQTDPDAPQWIIAGLGPMSIIGPVTGPLFPAMSPERIHELEMIRRRRTRESDEREAAMMIAASYLGAFAR